jgi:hypothetical protein
MISLFSILCSFWITQSFLPIVDSLQVPPLKWRSGSLVSLNARSSSDRNDVLSKSSSTWKLDRRSAISVFGSLPILAVFTPTESKALAASETKSKSEVTEYSIDEFSFTIPSSWKVTSNKNGQKLKSQKIFSAIDFQSGSVITVVREPACSAQEYAQSLNSCSVVLPTGKEIFSEETIAKDVTKLLIRHDDRDNTALQGTTKLDRFDISTDRKMLDLIATTTIPSGGVYRDAMGIDRPNTIDRRVKAKSLLLSKSGDSSESPSSSILTVWLSAPLDEWGKPVMGTKLAQIYETIQVI